jgi:membrane-associated protease RseP (regulator of RpoE activity)
VPQWIDIDLSGASRGMLGVHVLDSNGSVVISNVFPGSMALRAGLRTGDQITAVNGTTVATNAELIDAIRAAAEGDGRLALTVMRNGQEQTINATVSTSGNLTASTGTTAAAGTTAAGTTAAAAPAASGSVAAATPAMRQQITQLQTKANDLSDLLKQLNAEGGELTADQIQEAQAAAAELARILQTLNSLPR